MIRSDIATPVLTPVQRSVVEQPWDARLLVTAGAGAGKTTTLVHRLEHLVAVEELEAAEILVLTFSRAAARVLRERVDILGTAARRVRALTFDAWATAVLSAETPGRDDLAPMGFDARIEAATHAVERGILNDVESGPPAHVVVDEVQDLVGVRRELVETLLDVHAAGSGFTLVGDPAQSIYGFQVADPTERAAEAHRFFDWVRLSFGEDLVSIEMNDNFRARTEEARVALPHGPALQRLPDDGDEAEAETAGEVHGRLRATLSACRDFGPLTDPFTLDSLRYFDGTTAILCRDNGQVMALSETLHAHAITHRIQRSPLSRPAPIWVADLLNNGGSSAFGEDRFAELIADGTPPDPDARARWWRSVRRVAAGPRNTLDPAALLRVLASGHLPDELTAPPPHHLVLSTIHRAKGLEFDRVLVVEPQQLDTGRDNRIDPAAESRLLYVAMTRARDDLYRMARPDVWRFVKHAPTGRWYVRGSKSYIRNGLEVGDLDVSHEVPAGAENPPSSAHSTFDLLRSSVLPGDEVEVRRLHDLPMGSRETPPYGIFHRDRPIGTMSTRFRQDLWSLLKINPRWEVTRYPWRITGLRIDCVETVIGSASLTQRHGLGDRGVWLAPRLCGLGRFDWTHALNVPEGSINR